MTHCFFHFLTGPLNTGAEPYLDDARPSLDPTPSIFSQRKKKYKYSVDGDDYRRKLQSVSLQSRAIAESVQVPRRRFMTMLNQRSNIYIYIYILVGLISNILEIA